MIGRFRLVSDFFLLHSIFFTMSHFCTTPDPMSTRSLYVSCIVPLSRDTEVDSRMSGSLEREARVTLPGF